MLGPDDRFAGVAAGPSGRLDLEVVAAPGVDADDLAAAGHADPLLGRLMALHLGHGAYSPDVTGSGAGVLSVLFFAAATGAGAGSGFGAGAGAGWAGAGAGSAAAGAVVV